MDFIPNEIITEGRVKIRIEAVGGDLDRIAGRYPESFMNEMARQLTSAIESATGTTGIADSSVELIMAFASATYMEHISDNVTYRRLMLIDAVSAPRDFWVKWTRLDNCDGEYTADNILFELGEDVDQKIREKEYRYLLQSGGEKYHNSMGRKKVTEWREVIRRAAKRGELGRIEMDFELAPETLELEERIADLLGKSIATKAEPPKEEIPYITPADDEFARAMEMARLVVESADREDEHPTLADIAEQIVDAVAEREVELVPEDSLDESDEESELDFTEESAEADEIEIEELELEVEEPELEAEELEPEVEEPALEIDAPMLEIDAPALEIDALDLEIELTEEESRLDEGEIDIFEDIKGADELVLTTEPEPQIEEPKAEIEPDAEDTPAEDEDDEEFIIGEAPVEKIVEEITEPEIEIELTEDSEPEIEIEIVEEPEEISLPAPEKEIPQPIRIAEPVSIADRVADIRAELEIKIRLEYEIKAREKAEAELVDLRHKLQKVQIDSKEAITGLIKENERLHLEYDRLVEQIEGERLAREAEEARLRLEEQQLRSRIESQLRAEAAERERLAEAARMAIEEQRRLEAENARIAREREEEERLEAERRRREEHERELEAIRLAEAERLLREQEEARARAKAAMPEMGDGKYSYTSKTVKFLFRKSVDPNITGRIQEIIKATVDYYGKDGVSLRIKASVPDTRTVILEFTDFPIEEMPLLGNIIKILGNSGLGIAKAIIE